MASQTWIFIVVDFIVMVILVKLVFGEYKAFFKAITKYGTPPWGDTIN